MWIEVLKSKIHRGKVPGADLNYSGSITIDEACLASASIVILSRLFQQCFNMPITNLK